MNEYQEFLESKRKLHKPSGFEVEESTLPNNLFPFQKFVVKRALANGKYGVFSGTGTGKTRMQLTWLNEVNKHTNRPVLLLAPLAVSSQTIEEGERIGIKISYLLNAVGEDEIKDGLFVINYDQLDNIKEYIPKFSAVALDEGSILKSEDGATRNKLIDWFQKTPYKAVFTATPSPNDPMEIGNYAEFLNVMSRNEMLAMYFVHDGGETSKWRIKGHCKKIFWEWVSSWAIMFQH